MTTIGKTLLSVLTFAAACFAARPALSANQYKAASDAADKIANDGKCSLREAVDLVNNGGARTDCPAGVSPSGEPEILLTNGKTYTLTSTIVIRAERSVIKSNKTNTKATILGPNNQNTLEINGGTIGISFTGQDLVIAHSSSSKTGIGLRLLGANGIVHKCEIKNNRIGVTLESESSFASFDSSIHDNDNGDSDGGGVLVTDERSLLDSLDTTTVSNNKAGRGAGVFTRGVIGTGEASINNNTARREGGGIYIAGGGEADLFGAAIFSNTAGTDGGGMFVEENATAAGEDGELADSVSIYSNKAQRGAGIFTRGNVFGVNFNISSNSSKNQGGGLFVDSTGFFTINSSTITNNVSALSCGGNGVFALGETVFVNSIVGGFTQQKCNCSGDQIFSEGNNVATADCLVFGIDSDTVADPKLESLSSVTSSFPNLKGHRLQSGSPAINHGPTLENCPDVDLANKSRQQGTNCETGALEK
jgi:hypothetical protein